MKDGVYYWCYSTKVKDEINETNYWLTVYLCYIYTFKKEDAINTYKMILFI